MAVRKRYKPLATVEAYKAALSLLESLLRQRQEAVSGGRFGVQLEAERSNDLENRVEARAPFA